MEQVILVGLAILWAVVLLPPYLQNRSENRPADSISTFRRELDVLERRAHLASPSATPATVRPVSRTTGLPVVGSSPTLRPSAGPMRPTIDRARIARAEAKRRRRDVLVTLVAAAVLTLVLSLMLPAVLLVHVVVDVLLVAYVALLVQMRRRAEERRTKVRYLEASRRPAEDTASYDGVPAGLALRRAAAR